MAIDSLTWAAQTAAKAPSMVTGTPGPESLRLHSRMSAHGVFGPAVGLHPVSFASGCGVTLTDVDGNTYLDLTSGTVVTGLGHAHPEVAEAIGFASASLANVHDHATPAKVAALEALASATPAGFTVFNFFSAGTEAIEAAMRIVREVTGRRGFLSMAEDFHGRSSGAASVSAGRTSNAPRSPEHIIVPFNPRTSDEIDLALDVVESVIRNNFGPAGLAGLVIEPVQNRNGAWSYPPGYLARLSDLVHRHGGLVVADEIATGLGRTGAWFASEGEGLAPDVIAFGKGLGNGFPMSAVGVHAEHREAMRVSFPSSTFGGNPVACAALVSVVDIMNRDGVVEHAAAMGKVALERMHDMAARHPVIGSVRGRGLLLGIELVDRATGTGHVKAGQTAYVEGWRRGVAWTTYDHILRMAPPLVIPEEALLRGLAIVEESIAAAEAKLGL